MSRRSFIAAVAVSVLMPLADARSSPAVEMTCAAYSASARETATSPAGPFVGFEDVTIDNRTFDHVPATTSILAPLAPTGTSGVLKTQTSHTIALPTGTIRTTDRVQLTRTRAAGVYELVGKLVVTSGATGRLRVRSTLNLRTLSDAGKVLGTVCGAT
jgi:hypothetical protein